MEESRQLSSLHFGLACLFLGPPLGLMETWFLPLPPWQLEWDEMKIFFSMIPFSFLFGLLPAAWFCLLYRLVARKIPPGFTASFAGRVLLGAAIGATCGAPLLLAGDFAAMFTVPPGLIAGAVLAAFFGRVGRAPSPAPRAA